MEQRGAKDCRGTYRRQKGGPNTWEKGSGITSTNHWCHRCAQKPFLLQFLKPERHWAASAGIGCFSTLEQRRLVHKENVFLTPFITKKLQLNRLASTGLAMVLETDTRKHSTRIESISSGDLGLGEELVALNISCFYLEEFFRLRRSAFLLRW